MKKHIIFICNGNIHRSVIAAAVLNNILKEQKINTMFVVDSFGIQGTKGTSLPKHKHLSEYPLEWKAASATLEDLSIDITGHTSQKISAPIMKKASVVIAMDNKVYSEAENSLLKQFPNQAHKIHKFSELTTGHKVVSDPAGSGDVRIHRKAIKTIHTTLNKRFKDILNWAT